jgi:hypothetical protein
MTTQEKNIVGGDQAGRDIIKLYEGQLPKPSYMTRLMDKLKHEKENDIQFHQILEKLQEFCSTIDRDGTEVVGLDEKLIAGGFLSFIEFAKWTKEAFSKKLVKFQLYESAQMIYAHVLAHVYTRYHDLVYPLIKSKASEKDIHEAIHSKIVEPIQGLLEENVLELFADEINGAIYFLTGNCHIKWV